MPLKSVGKTPGARVRGGATEEMSLYAPLIEYRIAAMALDHFFENAVEANVPLETALSASGWWHRKIVHERVNRFSERWCLLFEAMATFRERVQDQIPLDNVQIADDLTVTWDVRDGRRDPETVTWVPLDDGRF